MSKSKDIPRLKVLTKLELFGGEKHKKCFCGDKVFCKVEQAQKNGPKQIQYESVYYCRRCAKDAVGGILLLLEYSDG